MHAPPAGGKCPGLTRALERTFRNERPEILDLGPMCGSTVIRLAERGARVTVEAFDPPPPAADPQPGEEPVPPPAIRIDQPDARFDLLLAWDQSDFVAPERLGEFGAELARVLAPGGILLLYSLARRRAELDRRGRYRVLADDRLVYEPADERPRPRWEHPTRAIERALAEFSVQGIQLQRDQVREILALRRSPRSDWPAPRR